MDTSCKKDANRCFSEPLLNQIKRLNNNVFLCIYHEKNPCQLTNSFGSTLLHYAAKYGNVWLVRYLIALGAEVDAQNHTKETPLMFAVQNDQVEASKILLEANADIYLLNQDGQCALGKVFISDHKEDFLSVMKYRITSEFLNNSMHAKAATFHRSCPLYFFMQFQNSELTKVLLKNGSPVDAKKSDTGETSLHLAIRSLDLDNVKVLLEYNANVNIETRIRERPLQCLVDLQNEDTALVILTTLIEAGANLLDYDRGDLFVASLLTNGTKKIVCRLLENLTDLHFEDRAGYTPLHYLADNRNPDILTVLWDYSFDKDILVRWSNWTMLHCVALCGNPSSVKFLLDNGVNVNAKSSAGFTALDYIIFRYHNHDRSRLNDYIECIEIFLAYGADFRIKLPKNPCKSETTAEIFLMRLIRLNIVRESSRNYLLELMKPIIAHESLINVIGKQKMRHMQTDILTITEFRHISESKTAELEKTKQVKLGKSITLFEFLTAGPDKISGYVRDRTLLPKSFRESKQYYSDSYYQLKLHYNYEYFMKLIESREKCTNLINNFFIQLFNTSVFKLAEKIVDHLDDCSVQNLLKSDI